MVAKFGKPTTPLQHTSNCSQLLISRKSGEDLSPGYLPLPQSLGRRTETHSWTHSQHSHTAQSRVDQDLCLEAGSLVPTRNIFPEKKSHFLCKVDLNWWVDVSRGDCQEGLSTFLKGIWSPYTPIGLLV